MSQKMLRREFLTAVLATPLALGSHRRDGGPVIDMHAHWYPEAWLRIAVQESASDQLQVTRHADGSWQFSSARFALLAPPESTGSLDRRIQAMDAQGVDVQVLSLTGPMVEWASPALGLRLAQAFNDEASAAHREHPQRFLAAATLPVQAPDLALQELERTSQLPGIRAIYLPTSFGGRELDDKSLWPIYSRCEQLGWPVLLHPAETVGRDRTAPYFALENLAGNPYDTGLAAAHLIFGGVLDAFPRLTVMLPHAGGTMPGLIGRWDRGVEARPELKDFKKPPSSYLRRFLYDIIAHNDLVLMNLIRMVGPDRVVLGSDFPFNMGLDRPVEVVERMKGLSAKQKDMILGGTAAAYLGVRR
jgi:aminocarboxymuconate-semialdehyde decarboxylase